MLNRRNVLSVSLGGFAAFAHRCRKANAWTRTLRGSARRCIILWMDGGPSQFETFDPKPGKGTGGPTRSIGTEVEGIEFSEHLPELAKRAGDLNVLRTVQSDEGEHVRASYLNHTGFKPVSGFPRPEIGSLFAHQFRSNELPGFVTLGGVGYGPAYLGDAYAPFAIENPEKTVRLLRELHSNSRRFELLDSLSRDFDAGHDFGGIRTRRANLERIERLLDTDLAELLDVDGKAAAAAYGSGDFARRLLMARRLIEGGVTCVEVQLGGWDTHQNNFSTVASLCGQLDRAWAGLIDDLKQRRLWEDTLVIWMGEFGRTPIINARSGRDHFPAISNVVLSGGGLPGGTVIGKTSQLGDRIEQRPIPTADLFATIVHLMGVSPDQEFETTFGSPTQATDHGQAIQELLG